MREAKDFLQSQINKGLLAKEELTSPDSAYQKIKAMLDPANSGYTAYFVRLHYSSVIAAKDAKFVAPEIVTLEKLQIMLNYLVAMKRLNKPIDISKHSKTSYEDLLQEMKDVVDVKQGLNMPGLIVQENDVTTVLAAKLAKHPWYVIACVKRKGNKWIPDYEALINWGSPRWCIKRPEYWKENGGNSYLKTNDHMQYVIIHEDFYPSVIEAAKAKSDAQLKLVPVNFGTNYDQADQYRATVWKRDSSKLRYGLTTAPTENFSFFTVRENLTCFNDSNENISSVEQFSNLTNQFPIRFVDIELRKILGMKRSEFDVSIPSFEEIIKHIEFRPTKKAEELIKLCGNFANIMEKAQAQASEYPKLQSQISPYMVAHLNTTDSKNIFFAMMYAVLYCDTIDDQLVRVLKNLFEIKNIEDDRLNMTVAISMLQIYMNMRDKGIKMDKKADTIIDDYMVKNFLLYHTLSSAIKDKPTSTIDFKRAMLTVFRTGKLWTDLEGVNANVTRAKMFKLLSNYLFMYDKEYGERILEGKFFTKGEIPWNDEVIFLKQMEEKIKSESTQSDEFIDKIAMTMLRNMPEALSDRIEGQRFDASMEDVFAELETHDYNFTYRVQNHSDHMFAALRYYITKMKPQVKKELLSWHEEHLKTQAANKR